MRRYPGQGMNHHLERDLIHFHSSSKRLKLTQRLTVCDVTDRQTEREIHVNRKKRRGLEMIKRQETKRRISKSLKCNRNSNTKKRRKEKPLEPRECY